MEVFRILFYGGSYEDKWESSLLCSSLDKAYDKLTTEFLHMLCVDGITYWQIESITLDTNDKKLVHKGYISGPDAVDRQYRHTIRLYIYDEDMSVDADTIEFWKDNNNPDMAYMKLVAEAEVSGMEPPEYPDDMPEPDYSDFDLYDFCD